MRLRVVISCVSAAILFGLCGIQSASAATTPLVQLRTKNCQTATTCVVTLPVVPAGARWELRQIACADGIKPTTVKLLGVAIEIKESNSTVAFYPFVPVATGSSEGTENWTTQSTIFVPVAAGQRAQLVSVVDVEPAVHALTCTLSGVKITN